MRIGELSPPELAHRLKHQGICLQTGPFLIHIQTPLPLVARVLQFLYADFSLEDTHELVDFHIRLDRPKGVRRWLRRQAQFYLDGRAPSHPMPLRLAVPLLEWGMNWCVAEQVHQFLVIHAAVVERWGRAMMIEAPPGCGKSTLCAALVHRGWRLFSDELALIGLVDPRIAPLARPIGLKDESIGIIRDFAPEAVIGPEWHETHKGTVAHISPPSDAVQRAHETSLPAWIVFLTYKSGAVPKLEPVRKSRAFLRVADAAFNYTVLGERGFETVARMVDACDCYEFSYGNLEEAVQELARLKPDAGLAPR